MRTRIACQRKTATAARALSIIATAAGSETR